MQIGRLEELLAITVGGQARSLDDKQPGDKQQQGGGERTGNGKIALASELMGLLRDEYDSVWDQLGGMWLWRKWLTGASKEEASPEAREGRNGTSPDGLKGKGTAEKPKKQVGVVGYGIAEAQLYKLVAGQEAGPSRGEGASGGFGVAATGSGSAALEDAWMEGDVWQRPQPQRVQLAARWLRELRGRQDGTGFTQSVLQACAIVGSALHANNLHQVRARQACQAHGSLRTFECAQCRLGLPRLARPPALSTCWVCHWQRNATGAP